MPLADMLLGGFGAGFNAGSSILGGLQDAKRQGKLAQLLQQGVDSRDQRQSALSQIARIGGQEALTNAQGTFGKMDDAARDDLAASAGQFAAIAEADENAAAQMYPSLAAKARAIGIPVPETYDKRFLPAIQRLAGATQQQRNLAVSPGSAIVDPQTGQVIYERPFAPEKPQNATFQTDENGRGWWLRPGEAPIPADMPTDSGVPITGSTLLDPTRDFPQLAQAYGAQVTSTLRTPRHNAEVGGVPNSQHMRGTAGDFVISDPQRRQQFIADSRRRGYEAIDEGDHVHVELPPGAQAGGSFGQPRIRFKTPKSDTREPPSGFRYTADGQSLEPIPGGPADPNVVKPMPPAQRAKLEQSARKERTLLNATTANFDKTISVIDDILKDEGRLGGVTGIGRLGAAIPGSPWADLDAKLKTLAAKSAFGSLQEMRANSPTGGALGQVSERELDLLQNAETQLSRSQSPEAFAAALRNYKRQLQEAKRRMAEGYQEFYSDLPAQQGSRQSSGVDDLLSKYGVK